MDPIRDYLTQKKMSVEELADKSGVHFRVIYRILGRHYVPGADKVYLLSAATGISLKRLIEAYVPLPKREEKVA